MAASICRKLEDLLSPSTLDIVNESHKHAGHSGNPGGGPDAETHFRRGRLPSACPAPCPRRTPSARSPSRSRLSVSLPA